MITIRSHLFSQIEYIFNNSKFSYGWIFPISLTDIFSAMANEIAHLKSSGYYLLGCEFQHAKRSRHFMYVISEMRRIPALPATGTFFKFEIRDSQFEMFFQCPAPVSFPEISGYLASSLTLCLWPFVTLDRRSRAS